VESVETVKQSQPGTTFTFCQKQKKAGDEKGEARVVNHSSVLRNIPFRPLKSRYFQKNCGSLGGNGSSTNILIGFGGRWYRYY